MTLTSDTSLNLKNVNTDLTNIATRLSDVLVSSGNVVSVLSGPSSEPPSPPITPNSATAALLSAIYGNLQLLDYLATQLATMNGELLNVVGVEAAQGSDSPDSSFRGSSTITPVPSTAGF